MTHKKPDHRFHRESKKNVNLSLPVHPVIKRLYLRWCRRNNFYNNGVIFSSLVVKALVFGDRRRTTYDVHGGLYMDHHDHVIRRDKWNYWATEGDGVTGVKGQCADPDFFHIDVANAHALLRRGNYDEPEEGKEDWAHYSVVCVDKPILINGRMRCESYLSHETRQLYIHLRRRKEWLVSTAFQAGVEAGRRAAEDAEGEEWKGGGK